MSNVAVRTVQSKKDENRFIKFQWSIYDGNPHWVPPLLMDRRKLIDRKGNPFYKHSEMEMFLAERDGRLVGRIAAIVNDNHIKEHNEKVGFFGFFECIDDQAVANALFDAVRNWLKSRGMEAMRGPASPSVNDEYGLLVDGFDKAPYILMSYNPPYYATLIERYGLAKVKDLYAYEVNKELVFTEKLKRVSEIVKRKEGLVFRSLNMKDFANEVRKIHDLYTRAWSRNWGEVPLTEDEFNYMAKDLKPIVNPELVVIAEAKGKPVGFGLSLPDLNQVLIHNRKGRLIPGLLRMLLLKKRVNGVRIIILGVVPEYLNSGIGGVLFYETGVRAVKEGYPHGEASWVLEDNVRMNRGAELLQGERTKTYRLYQMPI
jgi:hypothetical protein